MVEIRRRDIQSVLERVEGDSLAGANLSDRELRDADLYGADLAGANLARAKLNMALLAEADLAGANLEGAALCAANLHGARLTNANLCGADLFIANLRGVDLTGANLADVNLQGALFDESTRWPAGFRPGGDRGERSDGVMEYGSNGTPDSRPPNTPLLHHSITPSAAGADLVGAALENAHLECADLRGARLDEADLRGAYLFCAELSGASLRRARLGAANLVQAKLRSADLAGAHLVGARLEGANLRTASLNGARLSNANLAYTDLGDACLEGACLVGADLTGASLTGADLRRADLTGARLHGADLTGADLADCRVRQAEYDRATRWPLGYQPLPYERLEREARLTDSGTAAPRLGEGPRAAVSAPPTIAGVDITRAQAFADARRTLVVSYNSSEPPGILGYTVVVRPDQGVGDHYHHRRSERMIVLHGRAEFCLLDQRPDSPTAGTLNRFVASEPGVCVHVPPGVAHAVVALGELVVLNVLASCDYDPADDVHISLPKPVLPS